VRDLGQVDHGQLGEPLAQLTETSVHVTLPLLGGVILGVLREITVLAGGLELLGKLDVELVFQRFDLVLELLQEILFHDSGRLS